MNKELNNMITELDEIKEKGMRSKNPATDMQPQLDDLNKRFEAFKKEIHKKFTEPVIDPETGE